MQTAWAHLRAAQGLINRSHLVHTASPPSCCVSSGSSFFSLRPAGRKTKEKKRQHQQHQCDKIKPINSKASGASLRQQTQRRGRIAQLNVTTCFASVLPVLPPQSRAEAEDTPTQRRANQVRGDLKCDTAFAVSVPNLPPLHLAGDFRGRGGGGGAAELVQNQICSQQQMRSPPERRTNLYSPQSLLKILHHLFLHGEINNSAGSHFTSQGATCVSQTGETGSSISTELQERRNQFTEPRITGIKRERCHKLAASDLAVQLDRSYFHSGTANTHLPNANQKHFRAIQVPGGCDKGR